MCLSLPLNEFGFWQQRINRLLWFCSGFNECKIIFFRKKKKKFESANIKVPMEQYYNNTKHGIGF